MIIKFENNEDIVTYQYDDSVEGMVPEPSDAKNPISQILAGLPTSGISTDPLKLDHELFINLNALSEVRVFHDFNNAYALGGKLTDGCSKNIAFCRGMQCTILAFNKNSEGEFQRARRLINEFYEAPSQSN